MGRIQESKIKDQRSKIRFWASWLLLVALAGATGGCQGGLKPVAWSELGSGRGSGSQREESAWESRSDGRTPRPSRRNAPGLRVVARSNREVARLHPEDVVGIMQRVGFSDEQILDLGMDLYHALLLSGGAEVYYGKRLEMMFAVHRQQVHIQSASRGTFVYDLGSGRFVLGSAPGGWSRP